MTRTVEVDTETLMSFMTDMVKKEAETYGPVYLRLVAKNTCEFLAKKINDQSPPKPNTIEEANDYIMKNLNKYPDGLGAIIYGTTLAQNTLEGSIGAVSKPTYEETSKRLTASRNSGKSVNTAEAYRNQIEMLKGMHMLGSDQTVTGDGNSAIVKSEGCMFGDACKDIMKLGIRSRSGAFQCPLGRSAAISTEMATQTPHDYSIVDLKPPDCTFKIFKS
jgi:hypothetical protein